MINHYLSTLLLFRLHINIFVLSCEISFRFRGREVWWRAVKFSEFRLFMESFGLLRKVQDVLRNPLDLWPFWQWV